MEQKEKLSLKSVDLRSASSFFYLFHEENILFWKPAVNVIITFHSVSPFILHFSLESDAERWYERNTQCPFYKETEWN